MKFYQMDFGKLPIEQIDQVNFGLPPEGSFASKVLTGKKDQGPKVYVGCAKWGRKEWKGLIYPVKTPESSFLNEYVKHFNSIELNATFYKIPEKEQVITWRRKAEAKGGDFKFCPKFSRGISHIKRLKNAEELTSAYLGSICEFGDFLGPCFLQLSDSFGPKDFSYLETYLRNLPVDLNVYVELRHKDWFSDLGARQEFFSLLNFMKKGAVITDASGRRDCVHMELTIPAAFIRFVGNGLHPTDYTRIDAWVNRLQQWCARGLEEIYFFLHQHDEKDTPILADYTIKRLNEALNIKLESPYLLTQPRLFA